MKKYLSAFTLISIFIFGLQSCLKDKGFEDNKYGLKNPNTNIAVSIPLSVEGITVAGVDFVSTSQSFDVFAIQLESENAASKDIHVNLIVNSALVTDYNTANGTNLITLPTGSYNIPSLKVTIPAGSKTAYLKVIVPNASVLSPVSSYGLGFTIGSIDEPGIAIPENMKSVVVQFSIKNKYDGKYRLKGQFFHPTSAPGFPKFTTDLIDMITTGPNSVKIYSRINGLVGYYHPWTQVTGGGFTAFSAQEPEYTINQTTNAVTVQNAAAGAVTFYSMGIGYDNAGYNSRYDPASKTIYANFGYNLGAGGAFVATSSREWIDTLIYLGPR